MSRFQVTALRRQEHANAPHFLEDSNRDPGDRFLPSGSEPEGAAAPDRERAHSSAGSAAGRSGSSRRRQPSRRGEPDAEALSGAGAGLGSAARGATESLVAALSPVAEARAVRGTVR